MPSTVWLMEAKEGRQTEMFSSLDAIVLDAAYSDTREGVEVLYRPDIVSDSQLRRTVSFEGAVVSTQPVEEVCRQGQGGIEIDGTRYDGLYCGPISPDGRWMLFERVIRQVPSPPGSNYLVPESEMWLIELSTHQTRMLQDGLIGCGGCDGVIGPAFSASGKYAFFAETGAEGRVWLADTVAGTSREISKGRGINQVGREPHFSPVADAVVYVDAMQRTIVEDLATGQSRVLATQGWVGRFDASGRLLYLVEGDGRQPRRTHIFASDSGLRVATLDGAPGGTPYWLPGKPVKLLAQGQSFIAALEGVPGCTGTGVFRGPGTPACVDALGASVSPDGRMVALARPVGYTGQVQYPGGGSVALVIYDIVRYDVEAGTEQIVASGAISSEQVPPVIVWNEESTHFLVRWPLHPGL